MEPHSNIVTSVSSATIKRLIVITQGMKTVVSTSATILLSGMEKRAGTPASDEICWTRRGKPIMRRVSQPGGEGGGGAAHCQFGMIVVFRRRLFYAVLECCAKPLLPVGSEDQYGPVPQYSGQHPPVSAKLDTLSVHAHRRPVAKPYVSTTQDARFHTVAASARYFNLRYLFC